MALRPPSSPLVIGHRGASGYRPEHTRSAYELAFALGADAVEPDIVSTRDGVLVLRHENEISLTTNVASHPEFDSRRTTKRIDGKEFTGWFTEDFTWAELSTLRARERLGGLRTSSRSFDGRYPIVRLSELFAVIDEAQAETRRPLQMMAEFKHATYFESLGLPLDELFAAELSTAGWGDGRDRLISESFESTLLAKLNERGVGGKKIYLIESHGSAYDLKTQLGKSAPSYRSHLTDAGLAKLAARTGFEKLDGISVNKGKLLTTDSWGQMVASDLIERTHALGLEIFCWTLRPENRFLSKEFRQGRAGAAYGRWQDEFRIIIEAGIDGIFADQPDLAVLARREYTDAAFALAEAARTITEAIAVIPSHVPAPV